MLKLLKKLLNRLFGPKTAAPIDDGKSHPKVMYGDMVGNVKIMAPYQLDKHTDFKAGEQYRVGEGIATVHACKEDMWMAIMRVEDRLFLRMHYARERAIDLMMMTPEQIEELRINEWLEERKKKHISLKYRFKNLHDYITRLRIFHESPPKNPYPPLTKDPEIDKTRVTDKLKVKQGD